MKLFALQCRNNDCPPPPRTGLDSTVGVFGYLCLCLNVFFFSSLVAADPWTFHALTREDGWVENLTAVWFLLAGFLLVVTAWMERSSFRRCVYILGGLAMVFAPPAKNSVGGSASSVCDTRFLDGLESAERIHCPQYRQWSV